MLKMKNSPVFAHILAVSTGQLRAHRIAHSGVNNRHAGVLGLVEGSHGSAGAVREGLGCAK